MNLDSLTREEQDELLDLLEWKERITVAPKFESWREPADFKVAHGGRGAGAKSWSVASLLVQKLHAEHLKCFCGREIQKTLEESSYSLIWDTICRLGYEEDWEAIPSRSRIINKRNGSYFYFAGLKDLKTAKGLKGLEGYDLCWIDEAESIPVESWDLIFPTFRKDGSEIWITFNRDKDMDPVYKLFYINPPPNTIALELKPGKEDNPWFPDKLMTQMKHDYAVRPDIAEHKWGGKPKAQGFNAVMSRVAVRAAMNRRLPADGPLSCGVDVARFGDDRTVMYLRQGMKVIDCKILHGADTQRVAKEVWSFVKHKASTTIKIDDTGVGCVVKGTKVLTPLGWVLVEDLKVGDDVYSKDNSGNVVIEKVRLNNKREKTRIIKCGNFQYSFSHILPFKTRKEYNYQQTSWENCLDRKYVIFDSDFNYDNSEMGFIIPENIIEMPYGGYKEISKENVLDPVNFASFLGWYVSEGHFEKNDYSLMITQKIQDNIDEIYELCSMFGKAQIKKDGIKVFNKNLHRWIKNNCYKGGFGFRYKTVPRWVANNSNEIIDSFLDAFAKGDGFWKKGVRYYVTSSKWLVDDILELIYKIGKKGNAYLKHKAGSKSKIFGREITRKFDNYCIFEYQQKENKYDTCLKTEKKEEYYDNVYELCITGDSKLYFSMCPESTKPIWTHNGGVTDRLREFGAKVVPINFGSSAIQKRKYKNLATEMWFELPIDEIDIPDDDELMDELSERLYDYDKTEAKIIEPKKDFKERYGKSPDLADSLILCFYTGKTIQYTPGAKRALAARRNK
jgi:hypothetical protein